MTKEALKLALDALELCNGAETVDGVVIYTHKEIVAIKEAMREHAMREVQRLGQEIEQEPVKWADYEPDGVHHNKPPQRIWVGLTDEEMYRYCPNWLSQSDFKAMMLHVEAKLKQKNMENT